MDEPNLTVPAINCVDQIRAKTLKAIAKIGFDDAAEKEAVIKLLATRLEGYVARLGKIAATTKGGLKKKLALAKLEWTGKDAAVFAVLRGLAAKQSKIDLAKAFKQAETLSVFLPITEPVFVHWEPKDKGGYRMIADPGPLRRAQQLMVRDALSMLGIDSEFDFSKRGEGERALIRRISTAIEDGYKWWWNPDVQKCYDSIRPGHFDWLPIDRRVKKNVFFQPECAAVIVKVKPDVAQAILLSEDWDPATIASVDAVHIVQRLTVHVVRRSLCQGSLLSPLLARAAIAKGLHAVVGDPAVSMSSYCDDLFLGASDKEALHAAKGVVTKHFSSLPAGPIELHDAPVADVWHAEFLGCRLEPGKGHGNSFVHCKPGPKRIARFKRTLVARLDARKPDDDPFVIGERYWRGWFNSAAAWTKVPGFSAQVSWSITQSYIDDHLHKIPMGTFKANSPKLGFVGGEPPA